VTSSLAFSQEQIFCHAWAVLQQPCKEEKETKESADYFLFISFDKVQATPLF
jgi:hypothetical protein